MTIFFSTTVLVMITFMAFIINIGIFVKAKINLQNATDAAAYAGASVQARQLSNIAYLNWEMRNIYKEWMFKYYVLGGLNLEGVISPSASTMNFRMKGVAYATDASGASTGGATDSYNFPSICIDFADTGGVGLCTRYTVPGLPRFDSSNVIGMDEATNAFIDTIVAEKAKDCSNRSKVNFLTANTWAYNVTETSVPNNIKDLAPEIAIGRMGAFPSALELALRIRNLEAQVNFPPSEQGVCLDPGTGVNCSENIDSKVSTGRTPSLERIYKAFYSGFRNLGSDGDVELRKSFTLREIPPNLDVSNKGTNSFSTLLIPPNRDAENKYYVDLKLMTVNLATFYTMFVQSKGQLSLAGSSVSAEAECAATKVGLPIPGYPLGFVKNPDYMTYYAVEGKSKFVGLFNPFSNEEIVLKAYAAAKPFGGRIGPMPFDISDRAMLKLRTANKSSPFISTLDFSGQLRDRFGNALATNVYRPGMPIPLDFLGGSNKFWLSGADSVVGGWTSQNEIHFGIPNMIYDYPGSLATNTDYYADQAMELIKFDSTEPRAGLYNKTMFQSLSTKLKGLGGSVTTASIDEAILMSRAPTLYDVSNYMVPTPEEVNQAEKTDSWGIIRGGVVGTLNDNSGQNYDIYNMQLYAPMFSSTATDSLFRTPQDIESVVTDYLYNQEMAIEKYISSMNEVAVQIATTNYSGTSGQNTGVQAAEGISNIDFSAPAGKYPTCKSIAGKFAYFYTGNSKYNADSSCNFQSLKDLLINRWSSVQNFGDTYTMEYILPQGFGSQMFTAYRPGAKHDAVNGVQSNPLPGVINKEDTMKRNFYSAKFIPLKSLSSNAGTLYGSNQFLMFSEGNANTISPEATRTSFRNFLDAGKIGVDLSEINQ